MDWQDCTGRFAGLQGLFTPPRLAGPRPLRPTIARSSSCVPRYSSVVEKTFPTPGRRGRISELGPTQLTPRSARSHVTSRCDGKAGVIVVLLNCHAMPCNSLGRRPGNPLPRPIRVAKQSRRARLHAIRKPQIAHFEHEHEVNLRPLV